MLVVAKYIEDTMWSRIMRYVWGASDKTAGSILWIQENLNCGFLQLQLHFKEKVKFSRYRPVVAQRVGRVTAILFHDHSTRRGWVVSTTPWLHFTPGKDPVPIVQEAGWTPGLVWNGGKSVPTRIQSQTVQPIVGCYTDRATRPTVTLY